MFSFQKRNETVHSDIFSDRRRKEKAYPARWGLIVTKHTVSSVTKQMTAGDQSR